MISQARGDEDERADMVLLAKLTGKNFVTRDNLRVKILKEMCYHASRLGSRDKETIGIYESLGFPRETQETAKPFEPERDHKGIFIGLINEHLEEFLEKVNGTLETETNPYCNLFDYGVNISSIAATLLIFDYHPRFGKYQSI